MIKEGLQTNTPTDIPTSIERKLIPNNKITSKRFPR
jgi:hypothetical protein